MQSTSTSGPAENRTQGYGDTPLGRQPGPSQVEAIDPASWYAVLDGGYHGPMSLETLIEVLAEHVNDAEAPLWRASHDLEWTTMGEVPGLADAVALERALREGYERTSHPADHASFAISPIDPDTLVPTHSGELDIMAELRAMPADEHPTRADRDAAVAITGADPAPLAPDAESRAVARGSPGRRLRSGLWGLVVGALLGVLSIAASRPFLAPAENVPTPPVAAASSMQPTLAPVLPPSVVPVRAPAVHRPAASERRHGHVEHHPHRAAPVAEAPRPPARDWVAERARPPRSLDALLAGAVSDTRAPSTPTDPAAPRALPTRPEVDHALDAFRRYVAVCTLAHGVAAVRVTFRGDTGRVSAVFVDGTFAGTTAGSCMATAVRAAHVAPFSQPSFSTGYAYRF